MNKYTRRNFICGCSAAIAAMSGARFSSLAFAAPGYNDDVIVTVFLRGGMDALNLLPPWSGTDRSRYVTARPDLAVPTTGNNSAMRLGSTNFGLHPAASPLHELWNDGSLAIVRATGITTAATRSHFEAMEVIELGTDVEGTVNSGWLARHLESATNLPPNIIFPALSAGSIQALSLAGNLETIAMTNANSFQIDDGPWNWRLDMRGALRQLYENGGTQIHASGIQALNALEVVEQNVSSNYTPAGGAGSLYNQAGTFGDHMELVAQLVREPDLGLRAATVDLGGWDTHESQGDNGAGYFAGRIDDLAYGFAGFYQDLAAAPGGHHNRVTVVVKSEFGRRLRQNGSRGTDHGHAGLMLVLGGRVNGGAFYGPWPGLAAGALFEGEDLDVQTDYRRVLSEILVRRLGNNKIEDDLSRLRPDLRQPGTARHRPGHGPPRRHRSRDLRR